MTKVVTIPVSITSEEYCSGVRSAEITINVDKILFLKKEVQIMHGDEVTFYKLYLSPFDAESILISHKDYDYLQDCLNSK